jgi:polysaccharide export outer membrane protein
MTVQTAIAIAGGYTPRARKSRFKVTRLTPAGRNTFMLKAGSPVVPGDTIYVDERFF